MNLSSIVFGASSTLFRNFFLNEILYEMEFRKSVLELKWN